MIVIVTIAVVLAFVALYIFKSREHMYSPAFPHSPGSQWVINKPRGTLIVADPYPGSPWIKDDIHGKKSLDPNYINYLMEVGYTKR